MSTSPLSRRRQSAALLVAVVAAVLAALLPAGGASASAERSAGSSASHHDDYLNGNTEAKEQQKQCSVPVAQRKGNWVCPTNTKPAAAAVPNSYSYFQSYYGDYYLNNSASVEYVGNDWTYGYGTATLGVTYFVVNWTLNGGNYFNADATWHSTRFESNVQFEGSLMNPPPGQNGSEVSGTSAVDPVGFSEDAEWPTYRAFNNNMFNITIVTEVNWNDETYPGRWYMWAKSPIATTAWGNQPYGNYYFRGADQVPADTDAIGWKVQ